MLLLTFLFRFFLMSFIFNSLSMFNVLPLGAFLLNELQIYRFKM